MVKLLPALLTLLILGQSLDGKKTQVQKSCKFDPGKDFNATAFYLRDNATRFIYPNSSGDLPGVRIVCPGGKIEASGQVASQAAGQVAGKLECVGGSTVKLAGTYLYRPLSLFGCSGAPRPLVRLTAGTAATGKRVAELGYKLGPSDFLPIVDELSVEKFGSGYISRWAHVKALPIKVNGSTLGDGVLVPGELSVDIPYAEIYDAAKQKQKFTEVFKDAALVDRYLKKGAEVFVASQLISAEDLLYEVQRRGARLFENTVPVWGSVHRGNWQLVGEAVRQVAAGTQSSEVDVWSGEYLSLYLSNAANKTTYVQLPHGLRPAQFLFKVVRDRAHARGLVFVVVNNPHLPAPDQRNVICEPLPACAARYPQFADVTRGYTYCCSLKDFKTQAQRLGLPVFEDPPIVLPSSAH